MAASAPTIVIKVKYGDMLRRFNSPIVGDKLVLNIDELRKKILSLFSFAPDTEMMLTYLDEDDDVVALVDDDDLRDVVKQDLDPLRITVKLNNGKSGSQYTNSNASSTPLESPRVVRPHSNAGISEILSKVPAPLQETLLKLSDDLTAKAASSPAMSELIDLLSKVSLSFLGNPSESQPGVSAGVPGGSTSATETKDSECVQKPVPEATVEEKNEVKSQKATGQTTKASPFDFNAVAAALNTQNDVAKLAQQRPDFGAFTQLLRKKEKAKKLMASAVAKTLTGKGVGKHSEPPTMVTDFNSEPPTMVTNSGSFRASGPTTVERVNDHKGWGGKSPAHIWGPPLGFTDYLRPHEPFGCPFSGNVTEGVLATPPHSVHLPVLPRVHDAVKDASGNVVHRGVQCDGCDVHPITGPRFKSKVKVDYDLCQACFEEFGNSNDYIRMDRPAVLPQPMYLKGLHDIRSRHHHQHAFRGPKCKVGALKLDSRFIQDVNIFDGTVMAPSTPFTKIWRMRNNGTLLWPAKTQLVWIGGDKLSNSLSVELQIPASGLLIEQELDVAVDFISPELPGRYISYWRMASPSGQKFGQRVWVLIQVDASLKREMPRETVRNLNLNLPPVGSSSTGVEMISVEPEPMVEDCQPVVVDHSKIAVKFDKPDADQDLKFPINDSLLVGNGSSTSVVSSSASTPVSYPIIDLADVGPILHSAYAAPPRPFLVPPPPQPSAPVGQAVEKNEDEEKNEVEEKLLRELEEMGFKQIDLNKEVLRLNKYDLEQAVDDLCEWDPILDELQEMGFNDEEMNKKLLKKNKGSIKRVVMDLIAGESV